MALSRLSCLHSDFDAEVIISVRGLSGDLLLGPKAFSARGFFGQVQRELLAAKRQELMHENGEAHEDDFATRLFTLLRGPPPDSALVKLVCQGEQLDEDSVFGRERVELTAVFQAAPGPRQPGRFADLRALLESFGDTPGTNHCPCCWCARRPVVRPWMVRDLPDPRVDIRSLGIDVDDELLERWSEASQRRRVREGLEDELRRSLPLFVYRGIDVETLRLQLFRAVDRVPQGFALADAYLKKKQEYWYQYQWYCDLFAEPVIVEHSIKAVKPRRRSKAEAQKCLPWPAQKLHDVRSSQRCSSRLRWQ